MIRVRFAPSPTGYLHVGGARTALFNWLFARQNGGRFILRIEDTDLKRSTEESTQSILDALRWLGLDWDEGPDIGGPYGPYVQSQRLDIYRHYVDELEKKGLAYKCFCTDEELAAEREAALKAGKPPRYSGKCRHLSAEQVRQNLEEGKPYAVRLKVEEKDIYVDDLIKGQIHFKAGYVYDFIILKSDGTPTYNFAVVIDDAMMQIDYVIRGDDHLSNTPRQVMIYDALGFKKPLFAHIPMILGPDGSRLSKRHGATALQYFQREGYLPEAMRNFLALLGWAPKDGKEILDLDELLQRFNLRDVSKSSAVFNYDKLQWMNGVYIRNLSEEEYFKRVFPFVDERFKKVDIERLKIALRVVRDHLVSLSDVNKELAVFFDEPEGIDEDALSFLKQNLDVVEELYRRFIARSQNFIDEAEYRHFMKEISKHTGAKGKQLYMPLRILLSGKHHGPPLFSLISFMGIEQVKQRIGKMYTLLQQKLEEKNAEKQ